MTLTPERCQRARDVLHEAMQIDEEERSSFIDSQCASDPSRPPGCIERNLKSGKSAPTRKIESFMTLRSL